MSDFDLRSNFMTIVKLELDHPAPVHCCGSELLVFLFFKMVLGIAVGVENYRKVWGDILGRKFDLVRFGLWFGSGLVGCFTVGAENFRGIWYLIFGRKFDLVRF